MVIFNKPFDKLRDILWENPLRPDWRGRSVFFVKKNTGREGKPRKAGLQISLRCSYLTTYTLYNKSS